MQTSKQPTEKQATKPRTHEHMAAVILSYAQPDLTVARISDIDTKDTLCTLVRVDMRQLEEAVMGWMRQQNKTRKVKAVFAHVKQRDHNINRLATKRLSQRLIKLYKGANFVLEDEV